MKLLLCFSGGSIYILFYFNCSIWCLGTWYIKDLLLYSALWWQWQLPRYSIASYFKWFLIFIICLLLQSEHRILVAQRLFCTSNIVRIIASKRNFMVTQEFHLVSDANTFLSRFFHIFKGILQKNTEIFFCTNKIRIEPKIYFFIMIHSKRVYLIDHIF